MTTRTIQESISEEVCDRCRATTRDKQDRIDKWCRLFDGGTWLPTRIQEAIRALPTLRGFVGPVSLCTSCTDSLLAWLLREKALDESPDPPPGMCACGHPWDMHGCNGCENRGQCDCYLASEEQSRSYP